ncbi:response regulator transcription factor [soil metagenome]
MRLLVVEDEALLRESLAGQLKDAGFAVDVAADGAQGFYFGTEYPIDLAVIDLGLPDVPGIELIAKLREAGCEFPVLVLTARDRWQDKVAALQAGADDYVVKPFHIEEVLARLNALLRRATGWAQPVLQCGPVELDTRRQKVAVDGADIDLTGFEYRVLECLMLRAGEVVSKAELTDRIYDQDFERDSNVIEVFIGRLRRKLDPDDQLQPIETLRGRGYRFALERSADRAE